MVGCVLNKAHPERRRRVSANLRVLPDTSFYHNTRHLGSSPCSLASSLVTTVLFCLTPEGVARKNQNSSRASESGARAKSMRMRGTHHFTRMRIKNSHDLHTHTLKYFPVSVETLELWIRSTSANSVGDHVDDNSTQQDDQRSYQSCTYYQTNFPVPQSTCTGTERERETVIQWIWTPKKVFILVSCLILQESFLRGKGVLIAGYA